MDKDTRDRLKALLLDLPLWARQRERAAFVEDALWGHAIARHFVADGEPDTIASELF